MNLKAITVSALSVLMLGGASFVAFDVLQAEQAYAQTSDAKAVVDSAKAEGIVGETVAGYLGLVSGSAAPNVVNAMNEINIRRKSLYTRMAREQNVPIEVVAALTGEKVVASANRGEKVLDKDGKWKTVR